jgi:hypothetical protein
VWAQALFGAIAGLAVLSVKRKNLAATIEIGAACCNTHALPGPALPYLVFHA